MKVFQPGREQRPENYASGSDDEVGPTLMFESTAYDGAFEMSNLRWCKT